MSLSTIVAWEAMFQPAAGAPIRLRLMSLLAWLATCALTTGCLGPEAVRRTRMRYNEALRVTNDEQLLLNIVRLRYAESAIFLDLPSITSQFEATATSGFSGGLDGQGPGPTRLGTAELLLRDAPTLSYHPRDRDGIGRSLVTPLTAELLRVLSSGADTARFLLVAVNDINDISNASLATSLAPRWPDDNTRFRHGIELFNTLQQRGAIELSIASFDTDTLTQLPLANVRGRDAIEAVQAGYVFRTESGQAVLRKREKTVVLKVRPDAVDSFEMRELAATFGLTPGQRLYKLKSELADEEQEDEIPNALGEDTILLNMRSILQMMVFLSKGVCVPEEHLANGTVPTTPGPGGLPYDWTRVTAGTFAVRSHKHKPHDAYVAVRYRGYWFSIAATDVDSRAVLALFQVLLALQESERESLGPLLTLPIN